MHRNTSDRVGYGIEQLQEGRAAARRRRRAPTLPGGRHQTTGSAAAAAVARAIAGTMRDAVFGVQLCGLGARRGEYVLNYW